MTIGSNRLVRPLTIGLAVLFVTAGVLKLAELPLLAERFAAWNYPDTMLHLVGAIEILGGLLLLVRRTASVGAVLLGAVMLGAIYTHVFRGLPILAVVPTLVLFVIAFIGNRLLDAPTSNDSRRMVPPQPTARRPSADVTDSA